jgi:trehalose 6-phosphate phosphatase
MLEDVLREILFHSERTGLLFDYDGTLAEIVEKPEEATPHAAVGGLLEELAAKYRVVRIISGRDATQLLDWLGPDVEIDGLLGVQRVRGGQIELTAEAAPYSSKMNEVLVEAKNRVRAFGLDGIFVEDKGIVVTLHFRRASDRVAGRRAAESVARELADAYGLVIASGRATVELRPPITMSKGAAVLEVANEYDLEALLFAGDDVVDLEAFRALDELESEGMHCIRVAVASSEAPNALLADANVVVDGPSGMIELLETLARARGAAK